MIEFPVSVETYLTPFSVAVFVAIVTQWLKHYLPNWRWANLLALALGEVASVVATVIISGDIRTHRRCSPR